MGVLASKLTAWNFVKVLHKCVNITCSRVFFPVKLVPNIALGTSIIVAKRRYRNVNGSHVVKVLIFDSVYGSRVLYGTEYYIYVIIGAREKTINGVDNNSYTLGVIGVGVVRTFCAAGVVFDMHTGPASAVARAGHNN
jgi:hypothetical protein